MIGEMEALDVCMKRDRTIEHTECFQSETKAQPNAHCITNSHLNIQFVVGPFFGT